ncbi:uncharacterized protein MONBRDRAFT_32660 [Monosiga brevicollis MX1]|uniref:Sulfatase N-terminal domain-containing protein n=1 Tax=Monosiga brevicollis TaxID=81824 RepID=A9V0Z5_MONBE|nr:uncharacterized protein MONBRDRAFT_32660 [Monosiga brevicollis MX1]EDQ88843.1 predicted protein [Monosiga brevicollis MX1]|eukprot:XP_001746456.1 hypothetical protein [Monosiga brevicollis MX1]
MVERMGVLGFGMARLLLGMLVGISGAAWADTTPRSTHCQGGINYPGNDLPNMPVPLVAANPELCYNLCQNTSGCNGFVYTAPAWPNPQHATCSFANGCCWLKSKLGQLEQNAVTCASSPTPQPHPEPRPITPAPANAKNILSVDPFLLAEAAVLIPLASAHAHVIVPPARWPNNAFLVTSSSTICALSCQAHMDKTTCTPQTWASSWPLAPLSDGRIVSKPSAPHTVSDYRLPPCPAHANRPSRMSFLFVKQIAAWSTIRSTIRAKCFGPSPLATTKQGENQRQQLKSTSSEPLRAHQASGRFLLNFASPFHIQGNCSLLTDVLGRGQDGAFISGMSGSWTTANWTSHPQHFYLNGYLTASGSLWLRNGSSLCLPYPTYRNGEGMPPNQDPISWSPTWSMQEVNAVANMWPCNVKEPVDQSTCFVNATKDGVVQDGSNPLCDKTIGDDAVEKLTRAMANRDATGQPFFMAVGFRKPHLAFRFPAPWRDVYPALDQIKIAAHPTQDPSMPAIAHHDPCLQSDPWTALPTNVSQTLRLEYYSCVSWMDSQVGRVLDLLEQGGHYNDTLVVFHSDHGWNLGEHGQYEKFTNWETGTRVPLVIRAPWIENSAGKVSDSLVELVDVYPTTIDVLGLPAPPDAQKLDGVSLKPILENASAEVRPYALSQYPRCPQFLGNETRYDENNVCLFVDRTRINFMGYSIRTDQWRYTEWVEWNGVDFKPEWDKLVAGELYNHTGDTNMDFDAFENYNEYDDQPDVVRQLSQMLHDAVASQ